MYNGNLNLFLFDTRHSKSKNTNQQKQKTETTFGRQNYLLVGGTQFWKEWISDTSAKDRLDFRSHSLENW